MGKNKYLMAETRGQVSGLSKVEHQRNFMSVTLNELKTEPQTGKPKNTSHRIHSFKKRKRELTLI